MAKDATLIQEKPDRESIVPGPPEPSAVNDKSHGGHIDEAELRKVGGHLNATEDDILEAREAATALSLDEVVQTLKQIVRTHDGDLNFPFETMTMIKDFLSKEGDITANPEKHEGIIEEMKLEVALMTNNSPYAEVRAVVDNHDDPTMHSSTIRAWTIGIFFCCVLSFVNQLFSIRLPTIKLTADVVQLCSYPMAKAWERWVPRGKGFTIPWFNERVYWNPGKFNKKEHMLIAIMASVSVAMPYSNNIFWVQYLPVYFNQSYAKHFGYMLTNNLATNFIGYGLAGMVRRFLVYPAYALWPQSLVTVALNSALHNEENTTVPGPLKRMYSMSRFRLFFLAFAVMFIYFWIPNYLFTALSIFAWMQWIKPNNRELTVLTGGIKGMGLFNPLPTLDWNVVSFMVDPLMYPSHAVYNLAAGMWVGGLLMLIFWYSNLWETAHLPINSNKAYDHFGMLYNVSQTIDERGLYDHEKYMQYSFPYIGPALLISYIFFFSTYTAVLVHVILNHHQELKLGAKGVWANLTKVFRKKRLGEPEEKVLHEDVHGRLMEAYPEVSEWWYLIILAVAITLGCIGLSVWPTNTPPAVPLYGIGLCILFVVPIGIVASMTGVDMSLNILAEFFGGLIAEGNALALNYFKCYGYVTCSQTLVFANDLKVAHYLKIPPKHTFWAQVVATFVCTMVSTGVMVFQMGIEHVCTAEAPAKFICPTLNHFFTASILWGTIGPRKTFGMGSPYKWLLMGFPLGAVVALAFWALRTKFPRSQALRQIHIVPAAYGGCLWGIYNFSYIWPAVPIAWFSWHYIRGRHLAFWSKYNYVLSAAFSAGIALSALLQLFSVQWTETNLNWVGNTVQYQGCEAVDCTYKVLAPGERFYPWWDLDKVPANATGGLSPAAIAVP